MIILKADTQIYAETVDIKPPTVSTVGGCRLLAVGLHIVFVALNHFLNHLTAHASCLL